MKNLTKFFVMFSFVLGGMMIALPTYGQSEANVDATGKVAKKECTKSKAACSHAKTVGTAETSAKAPCPHAAKTAHTGCAAGCQKACCAGGAKASNASAGAESENAAPAVEVANKKPACSGHKKMACAPGCEKACCAGKAKASNKAAGAEDK